MKSFSVKARDSGGNVVDLNRQAVSEKELSSSLAKEGYFVTEVKSADRISWKDFSNRKVKSRSVFGMLRELRTILAAGIPVNEALLMVEKRPDDPVLSDALRKVNQEVRRGKSLPIAMGEHPEAFEPALAMTIEIGISSGGLVAALERYEADLTLRMELARKFRKAMVYPIFLLGLLVVVLAVLFIAILPNFVELYSEFDAELPLATQVLIRGVETAPIWGGALLASALFLWLILRITRGTKKGGYWLDAMALRIPVLGRMKLSGYMIQMASSLSLLLYSGMPLRSALSLVSENIDNQFLERKLVTIKEGMTSGKRFSELANDQGFFTGSGEGLLRAGERTGSLDHMLYHTAHLYEQELNDQVDFVTSLIEPGMMVIVGGLIGMIVIVVYLPIFGVTNVVQ
jgi:type II secretory pathway component PulF